MLYAMSVCVCVCFDSPLRVSCSLRMLYANARGRENHVIEIRRVRKLIPLFFPLPLCPSFEFRQIHLERENERVYYKHKNIVNEN